MGQDIVISLILITVLGVLWVINKENYKKRIAYIQVMLKEEWGSGHPKEYSYEEFETISHYHKNKLHHVNKKGQVIDDITWTDLDLDEVFLQINHTYSNIGEEYLYDLLRRPETEADVLKERERLITFFEKNEEVRRMFQTKFYEIGKIAKVSVSDYMYRLTELKRRSNQPHYLSILGVVAAILFAFYDVTAGVILFMVMIGINIHNYYKEKKEIEKYISAFSSIMKLLYVSDQFEKMVVPEAEVYINQIIECKEKFKKFRKGSVFLVSGRRMGASFLDSVLDYFRMIFHIDLIKFNFMLEELQKNIESLNCIMENLGLLDSMIAIASYRASLPYYCIPKLEETENAFLKIKDMYHTLIEKPVSNSIEESRGVLVTGSNASGKSTFLKTVAINAILAQTIHTCAASSYQASYFQIYSSMALKDNLQGRESYYIVEIKSLKRILAHSNEKIPMLCFVDEVLRGTNTVERIAASAQILKSLAKKNVMCFAATHDIELTHLLEQDYSNYHFQEEVEKSDIIFDYVLYPGRAVSRNAIKLLQIIGYDKKIIEDANHTAESFLDTGIWKL